MQQYAIKICYNLSCCHKMAKSVETTNDDGTTSSSYQNALTPVVTTGYAEYLTAGEPVLGAQMDWKTPRKTSDMIEALVQPKEQVKEATEGHSLSFSVKPNSGYTFQATKLTLKANVIGTGEVIMISHTQLAEMLTLLQRTSTPIVTMRKTIITAL